MVLSSVAAALDASWASRRLVYSQRGGRGLC